MSFHCGTVLMLTSRHRHCTLGPVFAASLSLVILTAIACTLSAIADEAAPNPTAKPSRTKYVEAPEQLIVELYVRDVKQSTAFFEQLRFDAVRKESTFVELGWDDSRLYLEQLPGQ